MLPPPPPPETPLPPSPNPAPLPPPSMLLPDRRCWCCCSTLKREGRSKRGEGGASKGLLTFSGFASVPSTQRSRSEIWTGGAGDVGDMGGEASETAVAGEVEVEVWVLKEPEEPRAGSGSMMLMRECLGVEVGERARKDETGESGKDETGEEGLAMTGSGGGTVMERAAKGLTNGVTCMEAAWKREGREWVS